MSLTPLMQLKKFPDTTISTRDEQRGFHHNSKRALFLPPHLEMRVHFPALSGKQSRHSRRTSRGGILNLKLERNSRGHVKIPTDPDVPIHSRCNGFPCTNSTVNPSIDSKHDGKCESPVSPREKATDPYGNSTGSLT